MNENIIFRWLGAAGFELEWGNEVILIDPFFSRPSMLKLLGGRPLTQKHLVQRYIQNASAIFITHSHYDHLMDAAEASHQSGAVVYGSANTCRIVEVQGVPADRRVKVESGDRLEVGSFQVDVLPAVHVRTPMDWIINRPITARLSHPLYLTDYRMDTCFSYLFQKGGRKILVGNHPVKTDVLFTTPWGRNGDFRHLIEIAQPKELVLIHWDNFFRSLSRPLRPTLTLPTWRKPFQRVSLENLRQHIETIAPQTTVLLPEIFSSYSLKL